MVHPVTARFADRALVERMLIWQARASRATIARSYGISPAYYQACAMHTTFDAYRPGEACAAPAPRTHTQVPALTTLEPARDAVLRAMGVRERQKLAAVPDDLIAAWQAVLEHPGLAAQFSSPIGFAVRQMQRGHAPPTMLELDRWVERTRCGNDRYEIWRHVDSPAIAGATVTHEQQLETRVRALAPPDADLSELCALASQIEAGATDEDALAALYAGRDGRRS